MTLSERIAEQYYRRNGTAQAAEHLPEGRYAHIRSVVFRRERDLCQRLAGASEPLAEVFVEIGEGRYQAATGVNRPDLAEAYPSVPALANAGFALAIRLPEPSETSKDGSS